MNKNTSGKYASFSMEFRSMKNIEVTRSFFYTAFTCQPNNMLSNAIIRLLVSPLNLSVEQKLTGTQKLSSTFSHDQLANWLILS